MRIPCLQRRLLLGACAAVMFPLGVQAGVIQGSKNIGAVWFIGDSITQSNADGDSSGSPRKSLYDLLTANGYTFTYTGHSTKNVDGLPVTGDTAETNLYQYHSGISGSMIGDNFGNRTGMTQNLETFWTSGRLATVKPNVILILLGTNDIDQQFDMSNAPARLSALVDTIYAQTGVGNPTIFLASIPPNRTTLPDDPINVAAFNAAVPGVVSGQRSRGRDVRFVDQFTPLENGWDTNMQPDNLHPNATGNNTMALQWYNGINAIVSAPEPGTVLWLLLGAAAGLGGRRGRRG
jgi:lysophospholipase L1-like esterase